MTARGGLRTRRIGVGLAASFGAVVALSGGVSPARAEKACAPEWDLSPGLSGLNGIVYTIAAMPGEPPEAFYVGGAFLTAGGSSANRVARWNGAAWETLGLGMGNVVRALLVFDFGSGDRLVAGGQFTGAGTSGAKRLAVWDNGDWSELAGGATGSVLAMAASTVGGEALVVGGQFTQVGTTGANRIARLVNGTWSALGTGIGNGGVRAIVQAPGAGGDVIVAGGEFTSAGGNPAANIAMWDGAAWSTLGSGMNDRVNALAVYDDGDGPALYAAGEFSTAGGVTTGPLARWDGAEWSSVEPSEWDDDTVIHALLVADDGGGESLFAGGLFQFAPGASTVGVARWDGSAWSGPGSGVGGTVYSFRDVDAPGGPRLVVGGEFLSVDQVALERVAVWVGCSAACANADINCDGLVNTADLGLLISAFGKDDEDADLNDDDVVNTADLGILIAAFGT